MKAHRYKVVVNAFSRPSSTEGFESATRSFTNKMRAPHGLGKRIRIPDEEGVFWSGSRVPEGLN